MGTHTFRATLRPHRAGDPGSWRFLAVPRPVSEAIADEAGPRRGFGSVRVEVTLGRSTWRTSVFPDAASGCFLLPVKRAVRAAEQLDDGETCEVGLTVRDA